MAKAIKDFENGQNAFSSVPNATKEGPSDEVMRKQAEKDKQLMVRPDARVKYMEERIDSLAEKMENLTLLIKNGDYNGGGQST